MTPRAWLGCALALLCLLASLPAAAQSSTADFFSDRLPKWFPLPKVPPDNPISEAKVELGRRLFYDTRLSGNQTYSCASCHQQALAFTDGLAVAVGSTGDAHTRGSMSLANVAYNASFGWDDRRWSLETQMEVPMYNEHPIELGLKGRDEEVLQRFRSNGGDVERFRAAFPDEDAPITIPNIIKAVASFERVLISGNAPFDRYVFLDDRSAMSPAARRGLDLFFSGRLRCSQCHGSVNLSGPTIFFGAMPSDPEAFFHDTGVAAKPSRFRAPTLRNIAVTPPYMHDGSIATLEDVVLHYAKGGRYDRPKSDRVTGFTISPSEVGDLVAFMESLTDQEFLTNPALGDPFR